MKIAFVLELSLFSTKNELCSTNRRNVVRKNIKHVIQETKKNVTRISLQTNKQTNNRFIHILQIA